MTPAMPDYKQCALSTSAAPRCGIYHFCESQRGGAEERRVEWLQPSLSAASIQGVLEGVDGVVVVEPGRHFTDEKSPRGNRWSGLMWVWQGMGEGGGL